MDTMEKDVMEMEPVQSDASESIPLEKQLEKMDRPQLVEKMNELGYQVDGRVGEKTIRENILKAVAEQKSNAKQKNEESLAMAVSKEDPPIEIRFFNLESSNTDIEFAYSGPRGMFGPINKNGFKKCPVYHLFPGETAKLAYSVYEHLSSKTFVTHKPVFDPKTGMIGGNIPIVKPRFLLQPIFTKEQLINMNK